MGRPTGTVTFLLTDVERSSALWDERPTEMAAALAEHDGIIRKAVEAEDGVVFSTAGDAFAAAFSTASAAAAAAMAIQGGMAASLLRVRMGLHTGVADERDGDYFGPTVNRAARLRDTAHGGQVVCSATTADLLSERIPDDARLVDHGEHQLKDLSRPERVWELTTGGRGPSLRSALHARHNLPVELTSFLGREAEVERLVNALRASRLVTVTGLGGVGKTRLALRAAGLVVDEFPDGVWFIDLAPISDPSQVAATVAATAGVAGGVNDSVDRVDVLGRERCLVVLDNCEHLIDACAEVAEIILRSGAEARVLATSRELLGVEGEQAQPVSSMAVDESAELFRARAEAVRPGFDAENDTVAQICERLDGIPLAIELAAGQAVHLGAEQILTRLADRFRLLTGTRRRIGRQQTLQAALDWSYDLLDPAERAFLRQLSVFTGPFSLEGAEAVAGADAPAAAGRLVAKSLITPLDDGRYRLLESVRVYAVDKLAGGGEAEEARRRQRDWYARRGAGLTAGALVFVDYDPAETDDIVAAARWSLDQGDARQTASILRLGLPAMFHASRFPEVVEVAEVVLPFEAALGVADRVAVLSMGAYARLRSALPALEWAERATEIAGAPPSHYLAMAWATRALSYAIALESLGERAPEGDLDGWIGDALSTVEGSSPGWEAQVHSYAASSLMVVGRFDEAAALYEVARRRLVGRDTYLATDQSAAAALALHLAGEHTLAAEAGSLAASDVTDRHFAMAPHLWASVAYVLIAAGDSGTGWPLWRRSLDREMDPGAGRDLADQPAPASATEADILIVGAALAGLDERWEMAARLLAASRRALESRFVPFSTPFGYQVYKRTLAEVRSHLDRDTARRCRDEGRGMSLHQAVAYAAEGWSGGGPSSPVDDR